MKHIAIIICLIITTITTHAQDAETGWTIIDRCVGDPIIPPDDWSFDGTILATGWAGIHGISAEWDVPRILAFRSNWVRFGGTDISPNRRWLVSVLGHANATNNTFGYNVSVYGLQVYDLSNRRNQIHIPWNLEYSVNGSTGNGAAYDTVSPRWLDNEHFIYRQDDTLVKVNPFTGEIEEWDILWMLEDIDPLAPTSVLAPSPNWSNVIYDLEIGLRYDLLDTESGNTITTLAEQDDFRSQFLPIWRLDSSGFIMEDEDALYIFDADGNRTETIAPSNYVHFFQSWSPSERYLVLANIIDNHTLHIADFGEQHIYNTCVSIHGWSRIAWHTESKQFAFYTDRTNDMVLIFDTNLWQVYETGINHSGVIFSWYSNPE